MRNLRFLGPSVLDVESKFYSTSPTGLSDLEFSEYVLFSGQTELDHTIAQCIGVFTSPETLMDYMNGLPKSYTLKQV